MNLQKISKAYFFGAMAISAIHTVHSFEKMGLDTGEQYLTPLAIDGVAFFALGLQSKKYDDRTNRIGLRLQIGAGLAQLTANIFAASSLGGLVLGILVVGIYLLMEIITPKIKTRVQAEAEEALRIAEKVAEVEALRIQAEKDARNEKARTRRAVAKTAQATASRAESRRIKQAEKALKSA